jgi:hypothetical protein
MKIYRKIKRLIRYIPVLWKSEDFDYHYSLELFKMKLEDIASFLESDRTWSATAKHDASRIRMTLRLMDKVYDEEYSMEYLRELEDLYGPDINNLRIVKSDKEDSHTLKYPWQDMENSYEIRERRDKLWIKSYEKQKRAHKLLWKLVEHNIQHWWD